MLSVAGISNFNKSNHVVFTSKSKEIQASKNISFKNSEEDSLELKHKKGNYELTTADKQEILKKARSNAAGWSVFGEVFSTLYYGLRSDKTVAKKYDLDPEKDKKFIHKIKKDQVIATIPGVVIPGAGGIAAYIYCKVSDADKIDVD